MYVEKYFQNNIYTIRRGLNKGLKRKGGLGFISQFFKLTEEEKFFMTIDWKYNVIYDIGAGIGILTMFFAKKAGNDGKVYAFEPHPKNFFEIHNNIKLNNFQNVSIFQLALGNCEMTAEFIVDKFSPYTGSLNTNIKKQYVEKNITLQKYSVNVISLDKTIQKFNLKNPDFIKIDVEGFEFEVLKGMKNTLENNSPDLYIEIHGSTMDKKKQNAKVIILYLGQYNYSFYHIEKKKKITIDNYEFASEGHLFAKSLE